MDVTVLRRTNEFLRYQRIFCRKNLSSLGPKDRNHISIIKHGGDKNCGIKLLYQFAVSYGNVHVFHTEEPAKDVSIRKEELPPPLSSPRIFPGI